MTFDAIALCRDLPGPALMISAMQAAGGALRVDADERTGMVMLRDDDGRPVLHIEGPRLVQVPGEAARLLGITAAVPHPTWWVETRAPGGDPAAAATAGRFVRALVALAGGYSWSVR